MTRAMLYSVETAYKTATLAKYFIIFMNAIDAVVFWIMARVFAQEELLQMPEYVFAQELPASPIVRHMIPLGCVLIALLGFVYTKKVASAVYRLYGDPSPHFERYFEFATKLGTLSAMQTGLFLWFILNRHDILILPTSALNIVMLWSIKVPTLDSKSLH